MNHIKRVKLYHVMIIWGVGISSILFPLACSKQKSSLKEDVMRLQSKEIHIPFDSMQCFNGIFPSIPNRNNLKYKLVVYTDSLSCSSCSLKRLFYWEPLIDSLHSSLDFVFIFSPKKDEIVRVKETLRIENLNCPVYIDTCSAFTRANPHIPANELMHTFLLNDKDSVILVGNPKSNPRIKELLFKILDEMKQ